MRYYKIFRNDDFIGIGTTRNLRRYQKRHGLILSCEENLAQVIDVNNKYYNDEWMSRVNDAPFEYMMAKVIEISEEEYNVLLNAVETGEEIILPPPPVEPEPVEYQPTQDEQYVKRMKIEKLSKECEDAIKAGFDCVLSDGLSHKFSLDYSDQIAIITKKAQADNGETNIIYHGNGEDYIVISQDDINMIYDMMNQTITRNTVYYNCLKKYVNSLSDIYEIDAVRYGQEIPSKYQTEVYKQMLK